LGFSLESQLGILDPTIRQPETPPICPPANAIAQGKS